jgi:hypothetical protein
MAHLDDQRLMELALGAATQTCEDAAHLRECVQCREALAAEADFSTSLRAVPIEPAPPFLAPRIGAAYAEAMAQRAPSRAPLFAFAATLLVLAPLSLVMLGRWADVLASLWSMAVVTRVLTRLVVTHGSAPSMLAVQAVMLLGGTAVVMRLLRTTAPAPEATR